MLPEKVVVLNETAGSILTLCDGTQSVHTITEKMRTSLQTGTDALPDLKTMTEDISEFLREMEDQGWVVVQHETVENK